MNKEDIEILIQRERIDDLHRSAQIENIAWEYSAVLMARAVAAENLADVKRDLEICRAETLMNAYATDKITGKNQGLRDMQELEVLMGNDVHCKITINAMKREAELALADIDVKYYQTLISLTKAALYAQSALNL